jgi:penicillin-insensitive murein DD-endopeptidase
MLHSLSFLIAIVAATVSPDGGVGDGGVEAKAETPTKTFDLRWSKVGKPAPGPPRVVGLPGAGCVQGAAALPLHGPGWTVVHPERHREFGHPTLITFLKKLAAQLKKERLSSLYVGDLGQPRGGPTPTSHRSHQSGIDVDLWYRPPKQPSSPGQTPDAPSVVDMKTKKMLPAWTDEVARLVQIVASHPAVDRIFVHPSVKRALCQDKKRRGPWLARVRPWWGHQDHLHARLRCPGDSPDCTEQQPLPEGEGCDAALNWWFSEDSRKTGASRKSPAESAPPMPEQCEEILLGKRPPGPDGQAIHTKPAGGQGLESDHRPAR